MKLEEIFKHPLKIGIVSAILSYTGGVVMRQYEECDLQKKFCGEQQNCRSFEAPDKIYKVVFYETTKDFPQLVSSVSTYKKNPILLEREETLIRTSSASEILRSGEYVKDNLIQRSEKQVLYILRFFFPDD